MLIYNKKNYINGGLSKDNKFILESEDGGTLSYDTINSKNAVIDLKFNQFKDITQIIINLK